MGRKLFSENAYSVLGLSSEASEKEILKRSREIENWLKIDEIPDYENDFDFSKKSRTAAKVKKATEKLLVPEKRILEEFFWIYANDPLNKKALRLYREGETDEAIKLLGEKTKSSPNGFLAWRNMAILESLAFEKTVQKKYLRASLKSWKTIFESGKMLKDFRKLYRLSDPMASEELLKNFPKQAQKSLADFYESIGTAEKKPFVIAEFGEAFGVRSDNFEREVLEPLLVELAELSQKIYDWKVETDSTHNYMLKDGTEKWVSEEGAYKIREFVRESDRLTDKIFELGEAIWDSSKVKTVRNKNAQNLRILANEIIGASTLIFHIEDAELADDVLQVAGQIASPNSRVLTQIEDDQAASERLIRTLKSHNKSRYGARKRAEQRQEREERRKREESDSEDYDEFYTGDPESNNRQATRARAKSETHIKTKSKESLTVKKAFVIGIVILLIETILFVIILLISYLIWVSILRSSDKL